MGEKNQWLNKIFITKGIVEAKKKKWTQKPKQFKKCCLHSCQVLWPMNLLLLAVFWRFPDFPVWLSSVILHTSGYVLVAHSFMEEITLPTENATKLLEQVLPYPLKGRTKDSTLNLTMKFWACTQDLIERKMRNESTCSLLCQMNEGSGTAEFSKSQPISPHWN